ncbi:helix-turn-helix domain-containing protein [Streptomyces phaeochromogenes]|uniref:helix-turn-helix domain-containing protein n=1 Tax=Streptomyces phaeochromogenes TaxID=1923 RepID=UPI002E2A3796|nr:helix-turn-helix domain-containing protein [Streptomyces phaeochromogenes]
MVSAALPSRRGCHVTTAEIVHAVWGKDPPTAAVTVLRTYVSRLRKTLEPDRAADEPRAVIVLLRRTRAIKLTVIQGTSPCRLALPFRRHGHSSSSPLSSSAGSEHHPRHDQ